VPPWLWDDAVAWHPHGGQLGACQSVRQIAAACIPVKSHDRRDDWIRRVVDMHPSTE
jgi:hypothetical protein